MNISNVTVSINGKPINFAAARSPVFAAEMPNPARGTACVNLGKSFIEMDGIIIGNKSAWRALVKAVRQYSIAKSKSKQSRYVAVYKAHKKAPH